MTQSTIFNESPITACWARIMPPMVPVVIEAKDIIEAVCIQSGFSYEDLQHKTRLREIVEARHIAMILIDRYTLHTLKSIGEMFGNRDHTTALHAIQTMSGLIQTSPKIRAKINQVEALLKVFGTVEYYGDRLNKSTKIVKFKKQMPWKRHVGYYSNVKHLLT